MKEIEVRGTIVNDDEKWIYDWLEITSASPAEVIKGLREADGDDVTVLVSSGGGDLVAGNEIYAALKRYKGNIIAEITGFAASAATLVCCGADRVKAHPGIQYMIHNVSSVMWGDHRNMETMADVLKNSDISIANIYRLKTGLSEKEILKMMSYGTGNNGTWMDAKRAKELGFVDEIIGDNGSLVEQPISIYNSLFTTVLSEETKAKIREQFMVKKQESELLTKQKARLALLKLKGGVKNV